MNRGVLRGIPGKRVGRTTDTARALLGSGDFADLPPVFGTWSYDQTDESLPVSGGTLTFSATKAFVVAGGEYSLFLSGTSGEGSRSALLGTIRAGDVLVLRDAANTYQVRAVASSTWSADEISVSILSVTSWSTIPNNTVLTLHVIPAATGRPLALAGATAATRWVGGTASGAPSTGTGAVGDFVIDQTGKVWVCTTAGSPGTWTQVGSSSGASAAAMAIVLGG